jgi:hypothetical protein
MLIFWRPAFRSGILIIRDLDENGNEIKHIFKSTDNGKPVTKLKAPDYVLDRYPQWFLTEEVYGSKKADYHQKKKQKKSGVVS